MDFFSTASLSNISTTSSESDVGFYGGRKASISSDKPTRKRSKKARRNLTVVKPPTTEDEPEFYPLEPRSTKGDNSHQQRKQQTVYLTPSPMAYTPSTKLTSPRAPVPCLHHTAKRFQPILPSTKSDLRPAADRHRAPGPASYSCPTTGRSSQLRRAPAYSF